MEKTIEWLLEDNNPAVKYNTLKYILNKNLLPEEEAAFKCQISLNEPVKSILAIQADNNPDSNVLYTFTPMYKSIFWQLYFLSVLGATVNPHLIDLPVKEFTKNMQSAKGSFPSTGRYKGNLICMQGMALEMLLLFGYSKDDFTVNLLNYINDNIYKNDFRCRYKQNLKCPWGATKVLKALNLLPESIKGNDSVKTVEKAKKFLISHDISEANYPRKKSRSGRWFLFGFPRGIWSDILELTGALVDSGCNKKNSNLKKALGYIMYKKNVNNRWRMEYSLNGKMPVDVEKKNMESKWVTYFALKTLVKSNFIKI